MVDFLLAEASFLDMCILFLPSLSQSHLSGSVAMYYSEVISGIVTVEDAEDGDVVFLKDSQFLSASLAVNQLTPANVSFSSKHRVELI